MIKIEPAEMEYVSGGKLTQQEIDDFLGAAGCTLAIMSSGASLLFGGFSCINWLSSIF